MTRQNPGLNNRSDLLSQTVREDIDDWLTRYPSDQKRSAVLAALRSVQHEQGYLSTEQMEAVADYLGLPAIAVYEVATFYSMYALQPVGQHTIAVCTNVSCMLCGADDIVEYIENKLGVKIGESTADGKFYLKREEECLAACCGAPMMQVDHVYYEQLTPQRVDDILDNLD
jgi:NADH-quinone oxidoreductase subunit E